MFGICLAVFGGPRLGEGLYLLGSMIATGLMEGIRQWHRQNPQSNFL